MTFSEMPYLAAVTAVGQYLCGNKPTAADILLLPRSSLYEYSARDELGSPSISFWPALAAGSAPWRTPATGWVAKNAPPWACKPPGPVSRPGL